MYCANLKISQIKENKDGSFLYNVEYSKEFEELVLNYYKKKKLTKKLLERAISEGYTNYLKREKE
jgi:hypothetical protein